MNCANHPDIAAMAYCRTCGKPLCPNCTRDVKGVIYCENCLAERLQGVQPNPTVYQQVMDQGLGLRVPPTPGPGPNPALAGILSGFFPFGVGPVYCGQYVKGLVYLGIFTALMWGLIDSSSDALSTVLSIGIGFFVVYQIIDSVRTARAIQMGQPVPDPFGLAQAFGADPVRPVQLGQSLQPAQDAERADSARVPTAAIILIGLGTLFLLQTIGIFEFNADRLWPVFLIALGFWLLARRMGLIGSRRGGPGCATRIVGPVVLITVGVLSLIESLNGPGWHRTWPLLLLAIGVTKLLEGKTPPTPPPPLSSGLGPTGGVSSDAPAPTSEVRNG
jgi:hypothetical protein